MQTQAIEAVKTERVYHFVSPANVDKADMPHCNNCGDVCYRTHFCVGHFVFCQTCLDEAEAAIINGGNHASNSH